MQVPGTLLVAGNALHFVETHARVAPADYLGLRALKVPPLRHGAVLSTARQSA